MEKQESIFKETLAYSIDASATIPSREKLISSIEKLKGELNELSGLLSVENNALDDFFSILTLSSHLLKLVRIDASFLPKHLGKITDARVTYDGNLILYKDMDEVMILDLHEKKNRDLFVIVLKQLIPKLKQLISTPPMLTESETEQIDFNETLEKKLEKSSESIIIQESTKEDEITIEEIGIEETQKEFLISARKEIPSDKEELIQTSPSEFETPVIHDKAPEITDEQIFDDKTIITPSLEQFEKEVVHKKTIHTDSRQRRESLKEIIRYRSRVKTETLLILGAVRRKKYRIIVERGIFRRLKTWLSKRRDQ
jgi:hypothetical protein